MKRPEDIPGEKLMAYLDGEMAPSEARAFEQLLQDHPEWREEVEELADIVDVSHKLHVRLHDSLWDGYWEEIDSRLSRRIGWLLASVGGGILLIYGVFKVLYFAENDWVRGGLAFLMVGMVLLFGAVLRGRLAELSRDRYRRVRR